MNVLAFCGCFLIVFEDFEMIFWMLARKSRVFHIFEWGLWKSLRKIVENREESVDFSAFLGKIGEKLAWKYIMR